MIPTPLNHLRTTQALRATMGNNPYHNQHIAEFTQCMDDTVTAIQQYYDSIILQQNEVIGELLQRVERLEQERNEKPQKVEAEVHLNKDSLRKVRDAIVNMFRQ